jgi:hypothetical protein
MYSSTHSLTSALDGGEYKVCKIIVSMLLNSSTLLTFPHNCNFASCMYGCETWSLTLMEEHRLGVFDVLYAFLLCPILDQPLYFVPRYLINTMAVCKFRGLTLLFRGGTSWRCSDSLFFEVRPLASDALLTTLHPFLENVLQTVDRFEISCFGAPIP